MIILLTVLVFAIIGLVLFFKTSSEGAVTYQQVIHRNKEVYMPYYSPCARGPCGTDAIEIGEMQMGEITFGKNAICQCPDGTTFQTDKYSPY